MTIAISNSSPLILLSKIDALNILTYFFQEIYIPLPVYHEVVEIGMRRGDLDAIRVQKLIDDGKIIIKNEIVKSTLLQKFNTHNVHFGELAALNLALATNVRRILLDDEEARKIARFLNLKVKGTLGLLIAFKEKGQISLENALIKLDKLNEFMYLSADLYRFVEKKLKN